MAPGLLTPVNAPVSQAFAGTYYGEPVGYYVNDPKDGRPLKAFSSRFPGSVYRRDFHKGMDQYGPSGTTLRAMEAGTVEMATTDSTGGKFIRVIIQGHPNSRYWYTHCSSFLVGKGAKVKKGQAIARMGSTGHATGSHVHTQVEFREKGSDGITRWMAYNPARFSPAKAYKYGSNYHNGVYIFGGTHIYDERIYPTHSAVVRAGVNIRKTPDATSTILHRTSTATTVLQVNELPGGDYTVGGVSSDMWAKIKITINGVLTTAYAAALLVD